MSSVAIEHGAISIADLTRVIKNNNLSSEVSDFFWWVVLGISTDISSFDIFN